LSQYFSTQQKNASVWETSEQFFMRRVQNFHLIRIFFCQSSGKIFLHSHSFRSKFYLQNSTCFI